MSLSKTLYPLLKVLVKPRKTHPNMTDKLLTGTLRIKVKKKKSADNKKACNSYPLQTDLDPICLTLRWYKGAQWLSGRVLDSRPRGRGFELRRRHCVVVLEQDTFILA